VEERLTTELAVEDWSSPANQETVESELNFDPVHRTDVQKFYNKFCSLGLLKEALE